VSVLPEGSSFLTNSLTFETQCGCGFNPFGKSYCPNIYTQTYTTLLAKVTKRFSSECHTQHRLNIYECLTPNVESEEDIDLLNQFIIEHYEREENNHIRDND